MKFIYSFIIFSFICLFFTFGHAKAKPVVAFGYMDNIEKDPQLKYLELILPNSFANSINAIFDVQVKKPLHLEKELRGKGKSLGSNFEFYNLHEFIKEIESDMFVFGSFRMLSANRIEIILNIYMKGQNEIFTFTNIGRMETQISKLVDRISIVIINFMSERSLYKVRKILPGTRLAILTNLQASEQNNLFIAFMKQGYHIICFQASELYNIVDDSSINKFTYISTGKNSYEKINDWRKSTFYHGTWLGKKHEERVKYLKSLYETYELNYKSIVDKVLIKIDKVFGQKIDVLLIIGFSPDRRTSWVRAIDIKERELIWMQSNIKTELLAENPVMKNVKKIIANMTAEPVNPFKKK